MFLLSHGRLHELAAHVWSAHHQPPANEVGRIGLGYVPIRGRPLGMAGLSTLQFDYVFAFNYFLWPGSKLAWLVDSRSGPHCHLRRHPKPTRYFALPQPLPSRDSRSTFASPAIFNITGCVGGYSVHPVKKYMVAYAKALPSPRHRRRCFHIPHQHRLLQRCHSGGLF